MLSLQGQYLIFFYKDGLVLPQAMKLEAEMASMVRSVEKRIDITDN